MATSGTGLARGAIGLREVLFLVGWGYALVEALLGPNFLKFVTPPPEPVTSEGAA